MTHFIYAPRRLRMHIDRAHFLPLSPDALRFVGCNSESVRDDRSKAVLLRRAIRSLPQPSPGKFALDHHEVVTTSDDQGKSHGFALFAKSPTRGGIFHDMSEIYSDGEPVGILTKVVFLQGSWLEGEAMHIDPEHMTSVEKGGDTVSGPICDPLMWILRIVRPILRLGKSLPLAKCSKFLGLPSAENVVISSLEAGEGLANLGFCDIEKTTITFERDDRVPFKAVHILPFTDTVPRSRTIDIFQDIIKPFLRQRRLARWGAGDVFSTQGIEFKVVATEDFPEGITKPADLDDISSLDPGAIVTDWIGKVNRRRISRWTRIYFEGEVLPSWFDVLPVETLREIQSLPATRQPIALLSAISLLDNAVISRVIEAMQDLDEANDDVKLAEEWELIVSASAAAMVARELTTCVICMQVWAENDDVVTVSCEHSYHKHCLRSWYYATRRHAAALEGVKCPTCRTTIKPIAL